MEKEFRSKYHYSFYTGMVIFFTIITFGIWSIADERIRLIDFLSIFLITTSVFAWFIFRFQCKIEIQNSMLSIKYFLPYRKIINIDLVEVLTIEKHPEAPKRYFDKLYIQTYSRSYLIKYVIAESSDVTLLRILEDQVKLNTVTNPKRR